MALAITCIVAFLATSLTIYFAELKINHQLFRAIVPGAIAAIVIVTGHIIDNFVAVLDKPHITTSYSKFNDSTIQINVMSDNQSVSKVNLELHLPSHVFNKSSRSMSDADSHIFIEGEQTPEYLTNKVYIELENIKPKVQNTFFIQFKPGPVPDISYADKNAYLVSYVWEYKGVKHYGQEWHSISDGKIVESPLCQISAIRMIGDMNTGTISAHIKSLRKAEASDNKDVISLPTNTKLNPAPNSYQHEFSPIIPRKE